MVQIGDLVDAAEKFQRASGERTEALATLTGLTRVLLRNELPLQAAEFIEGRIASELMPGGGFEGRISRHVLMSAMADAVRVGMRCQREIQRGGAGSE